MGTSKKKCRRAACKNCYYYLNNMCSADIRRACQENAEKMFKRNQNGGKKKC